MENFIFCAVYTLSKYREYAAETEGFLTFSGGTEM